MSANRVTKPRQRDLKKERQSQSDWISRFGTGDVMPCTPCFKARVPCKMSERSRRCARCHKNGKPCDGVLVGSSLERTTQAIDKTDEEIDRTEERLAEAQQKAIEAHREATEVLARLTRLRRQRRFLRDRGDQLLERGAQELDEIDKVNADLPGFGLGDVVHLESTAVDNAHDVGAFGVFDWNAVTLDGVTVSEVPLNSLSTPLGSVRQVL